MTVPATPLARTPLHHWHAAHGARFAEFHGWQVVAAYGGAGLEAESVRAGVGLVDISANTKTSLLSRHLTAAVRGLVAEGAAVRPLGVSVLNAEAKVLACRLTDGHLLLLARGPGPINSAERLTALCQEHALHCEDVTAAYAGFCLVGPAALGTLGRLTALDLSPSAFPNGSCAETGVAGVQALLVKPPMQSLPCVQLYVAWDVAQYVWETLLESGKKVGMVPVGSETLQRLGA
jgi:glycine cleavage system aminomethyltransferase T